MSPPAPEVYGLGKPRPRSQSLFDILQKPRGQGQTSGTERTVAFSEAFVLDRSLPPIGSDVCRSRFGTDPAPQLAGGSICCPSDCQGQACSNSRTLIHRLATGLILLDTQVRSLLQKDHHSSNNPPDIDLVGTEVSLQWAYDLLQWSNSTLRDHIGEPAPRSLEQSPFQPDTSPIMRRGQNHLEQREEQSPQPRQYASSHHGFPTYTHPSTLAEESRRYPYSSEITPVAGSPHHTTSSTGSVFMPPQSPMHAPQPTRSAMLPSPSSMSFANLQNLPPISPPSASLPASAHAAHLQDLQHQISVKTLSFQTLQREYDNLLQKLERQRTKCTTLEKKFEVSDVEINSLTDEKEKLQAQVSSLETQVEDLQQSRDEARRQLVANGAQYMRIMEMANRLQAQGADDKKRWEGERSEMEKRIKVLEEAMVTGTERHGSSIHATETTPQSRVLAHNHALSLPTSSSPSSTETVNVLRAEIGRLRARTQTLENALQTMKGENISIQAAARQLVESSSKIEIGAHAALGG
ncbi:hypothetical protein BDV95DRAFT_166880 [Massariosphaeria phaeospora]|uniref:Uncharacterized protein n=1 Tax=Massariosphaeria phaeospora TaxID=100035 RepID=A0A7C8MIK1_9PLEO|nr:hypothetical protein BDV95DRAFT_166880 [Massariosphaeria phaeospora]